MIRVFAFLFLEMCVCVAVADPIPRLTVCDLLAKRAEYNGKVIAVRGQVAAGGHGIYLVAPTPCSHQLVTRGVIWPDIINLDFPNNRSRDLTDRAPFNIDWKALRPEHDYLLKAGYKSGVDIEMATYIGLFVTYSNLDERVNPGLPGALRLGFGPTGLGAPAQLLMKSIQDVAVTKGSDSSQDHELRLFLQRYLRSSSSSDDRETRYSAAAVDLNGDGRPEFIVYVSGPRWCGSGGCVTLVLTRDGEKFAVVTKITVSRPPIRVLARKTNGWRDIGVWVEGGGVQPGYEAQLRFNGSTYPENPTVSPARREQTKFLGDVVVAREDGVPVYE